MLALIEVKTNRFVKEVAEGGVATVGRRRLVSPAYAGWTDGEYRLAPITERPLTAGKERTGEAPTYTVRSDDVEKVYPEREPAPARMLTRAEKVDTLLAGAGLTRRDLIDELGLQEKEAVVGLSPRTR